VKRISSEVFVRALMLEGFAVFRQTSQATILERGFRAVAVRHGTALGSQALMDLRRMAGLSWQELDAALDAAEDLSR
jgi:hypothetical protein